MAKGTIANASVVVAAFLLLSPTVHGQCSPVNVSASDSVAADHFGQAVSLTDGFALIGAPGAERTGREFVPSYIFRRERSGWIEDTILSPGDISPRSQFGKSVALSEAYAVVGAVIDGHSEPYEYDGPGSVYVYSYGKGFWTEAVKLTASDAAMGGFFGHSVGTSGRRVVVGATGQGLEEANHGSVYVFERVGRTWA